MRIFTRVLGAVVLILAGSAIAAEISIENAPYPGAVALSQNRSGAWIYQSFPTFQPLYIFRGEPAGKSACDEICIAVWPIIRADDNATPIGFWTIIKRADGRRQWAFKGKPVYMYFEDEPNDPRGVGKEQEWFLDDGGISFLQRAGVTLPPDFKPIGRKKSSGTKITAELLLP